MSATPTSSWFRQWARTVRRINYEVHLVQYGLAAFAQRHPWWGLPPAVAGLAVLWLGYWMLWPLMMGGLALTGLLRPFQEGQKR